MEARILTCNEKEQRLSKQKALLMEFFLRNPGKTLTREQIFLRVWGSESAVEDGNLDTYIYFLRAPQSRPAIRSSTELSAVVRMMGMLM